MKLENKHSLLTKFKRSQRNSLNILQPKWDKLSWLFLAFSFLFLTVQH